MEGFRRGRKLVKKFQTAFLSVMLCVSAGLLVLKGKVITSQKKKKDHRGKCLRSSKLRVGYKSRQNVNFVLG